jgi:ethanolamine utilization microcompartment shell protein EutL
MPLADSVEVWIGAAADVERALNQVHADLDEECHFILDVPGGNMAFLHSAKEVMVTSAMAYLMNGKCMSLYMLMLGEAPSSKPEIKFGEDQ